MRAVAFDLDGTLVDSFEDIAEAANFALETLGRSARSLQEVKQHVGRGLENLMKDLLPGEEDRTIREGVDLVKSFYRENPAIHSKPYPGAAQVLDELGRRNIIRCVLSNKMDALVEAILGDLGLLERLEVARGHREGTPLKPDPTVLLEILGEKGVEPEECLVVGDASPDRELARNAGSRFCAVSYGTTPPDAWNGIPDRWILDDLRELPALLDEIGGGHSH